MTIAGYSTFGPEVPAPIVFSECMLDAPTPEAVLAAFVDACIPVFPWLDGVYFDFTHPNQDYEKGNDAYLLLNRLPGGTGAFLTAINGTSTASMANIHNLCVAAGLRPYVFEGKLDFSIAHKDYNPGTMRHIILSLRQAPEQEAAFQEYVLRLQAGKGKRQ